GPGRGTVGGPEPILLLELEEEDAAADAGDAIDAATRRPRDLDVGYLSRSPARRIDGPELAVALRVAKVADEVVPERCGLRWPETLHVNVLGRRTEGPEGEAEEKKACRAHVYGAGVNAGVTNPSM